MFNRSNMLKTMKKSTIKSKSVAKGAPSGFVISLLVHAAAFMLAGLLVVFNVVQKEEKKFVPPKPVNRPKMKLRKPKVKIKKSAKPKSTQRIVTKVKRASMPDIQLPEMSGIGDGFGGDLGGFDLMPDLGEVSLMGSKISTGNDLVGVYYDLKRDRSGRNISASKEEYQTVANRFMKRGWNPRLLSRYYQAPQKLYTQAIVIPETMSSVAPLSFADVEGVGAFWLIHYQGELVHKDGITFRFCGAANEFMIVRVNGEIVLGCCWNDARRGVVIGNLWESSSLDTDTWHWGRGTVEIGDWITLEPGVPLKIEVLLGDNGWTTGFILGVEVEGEKYERSSQGAPILPVFKTSELSLDYLDTVYKEQPEGEVCLTNGPVFRDY